MKVHESSRKSSATPKGHLTLHFLVSVVTILNTKTNSCKGCLKILFVEGIFTAERGCKSKLSLTSGCV